MSKRLKASTLHLTKRFAVTFGLAALGTLGLAGTAPAQITGFGGVAMTGWTPNSNVATNPGSAGLPSVTGSGTSGDVLTLTNNNGGIATSYWFNTPENISNFTESFTYTGANGADGIAAAWQFSSLNALGGGGGAKGFAGISSAAALNLNIYGGNSGSGSGFSNGTPTNNNGLPTTPTPGNVDITTGNPINVSMSYKESDHALTETMTDTVTNATFTRVWRGISIQGQVGGTVAYVGFTGGTGGVTANQSVTNFQFTPGAAAATPVATITPIAATGYNQNMISSVASGGTNLTATMDGGTGKGGDTFYEIGVNPTSNISGVPAAGAVFGSGTDSNHTFVLQPNAAGQNDAVMLDATNTSGTLTLTTPARYSQLSFLIAGGNGGNAVGITLHYSGGGTQSATINAPDWFNNGPIAWDANGRADVNLDDFNNVNDGNPRMYQQDFIPSDTIDPILSVDFTYQGTSVSTDREAIFGLSGTQVVPEPSSMALVSLGALGFLVRRYRSRRAEAK